MAPVLATKGASHRLMLEKAQEWQAGDAMILIPAALRFIELDPLAPPSVALEPLLASMDGTVGIADYIFTCRP